MTDNGERRLTMRFKDIFAPSRALADFAFSRQSSRKNSVVSMESAQTPFLPHLKLPAVAFKVD